ncbi:hypothetical protein E2C01_095128 [Portunus trituberculatus]|uniref:Uncharacterized protein n=1 Tax=Portunus trituberculatus TaxID=210409 RepID=A0A5B7JSB9_PORTR|nr:hypothetical protein [Portunus trituberculatus]
MLPLSVVCLPFTLIACLSFYSLKLFIFFFFFSVILFFPFPLFHFSVHAFFLRISLLSAFYSSRSFSISVLLPTLTASRPVTRGPLFLPYWQCIARVFYVLSVGTSAPPTYLFVSRSSRAVPPSLYVAHLNTDKLRRY